ncbi:MAG: alpha/beta fold hydrolase [Microthrixaceae bacterium]
MRLHSDRSGTGPPIVLVHGFTQTNACWGREATDLATDHEVVRVDAPGHGRSSAIRADFATTARLLTDVGGSATYLGYSMGARLCLSAALTHPEAVRGLVLVGGTAGIDDPGARAGRRADDAALAASIRRDGVEAFVDRWLALPLFAGLPPERSFRAERLTNTADGLASSLETVGTGEQEPSWDALHRLDMPVLVLAGARDEKFSLLAQRMVEAIGANATLALIPDAGHTAHLEQPDAFLASLRRWLATHDL